MLECESVAPFFSLFLTCPPVVYADAYITCDISCVHTDICACCFLQNVRTVIVEYL